VSLNQCHAPVTAFDVVTFRCFSTSARADWATGLEKTTEIGCATPTVPPRGVIVSSSIGGPAGFVGLGFAVALPEVCALPSDAPEASAFELPPHAVAPTSSAPATSAIPMLLLRRPMPTPTPIPQLPLTPHALSHVRHL
jgi:hypothetical protein